MPRFYRGISFALVQAPVSRFVATFANDGCQALLASLEMTKHWGPARGTMISSVVVGMWRVFLMPIDTCKTVLQVDSRDGFKSLMHKVRAGKINVLYQGALALIASSMISYYPWFYSYRVLSESDICSRSLCAGAGEKCVHWIQCIGCIRCRFERNSGNKNNQTVHGISACSFVWRSNITHLGRRWVERPPWSGIKDAHIRQCATKCIIYHRLERLGRTMVYTK